MPVRQSSGGDAEVLLLDRPRDGTRLSLSNLNTVDAPDRRQLGGSPREEQLVGDVEELPWERLLAHFVTQVTGDGHHGVARDPVEDPGPEGRRVDDAVADRE